jgi:hypothetical protein
VNSQSAQKRRRDRQDVRVHPRVRSKVPVLARSDGTVVDGHLRLKSARTLGSWPGGDITGIPVILCDEWTDAQVKAFRILVNRSVTWAEFDDYYESLKISSLFRITMSRPTSRRRYQRIQCLEGDLWLCGNRRNQHRILCGDATSPEAVAHLLGDRKPFLTITTLPTGSS